MDTPTYTNVRCSLTFLSLSACVIKCGELNCVAFASITMNERKMAWLWPYEYR